ncbi:MAG: AbrB/MazE/SpoVT family DNA-binding domain-containing protein [Chloroflexi bacterium]|jgi:AbrB family looped-hinge helix DNA binding protein|nr:AbrB/MazE/SpoVT family DNA-binding domain-containing protein [Chloroflexota bacterium]
MSVKLSSKGQLVIPKSIRETLGLKKGTRFYVQIVEGRIILEPEAKKEATSPIDVLYGKYADTDLLADLEEEHRQELQNDTPLRS